MAEVFYGEGKRTGYPLTTRTWTRADTNTLEVEAQGDYDTLDGFGIKPGVWFGGGSEKLGIAPNFGVKSASLTRDDGGIATLRISLVKISFPSSPFSTTYDIDMQVDQRDLKGHPYIVAGGNTTRNQINLWIQGGQLWKPSLGPYYLAQGSASEPLGVETALTDERAIKYANAVIAGLESYGVYLPVVTKTSNYINLPGTVDAGVTPKTVSYDDKCGKFEIPPITLSGYPRSRLHWFKSSDKLTRSNDGSWQRTESWTYTDRTEHSWIYEELEEN